MAQSCCGKPIAKIIKIGNFDAGIIGLETTLKNVYSSGVKDEEQIKSELFRLTKEFGNYISPGNENDYSDALLREYKKYFEKMESEANRDKSEKR